MFTKCEKISIIVPMYNVQDCLEECLNSLVGQSYENLEIIIVNDGSTDGSLAIAEEYGRRDERIVLVNQENRGLSSARNLGISRATGDYVMFVDSDDYIDRETCEKLSNTVNEDYADLVVFGLTYLYGGRLEKRKVSSVEGRILGKRYLLDAMSRGEFTPTVCNKFVHIDIAKDITFPVGIMHEDIYYTIIALLKSKFVALQDDANYIYRKNRYGSITSYLTVTRVQDVFTVYNLLFDKLSVFDREVLNNDVFVDNIVERVNMEVLIKLVDGTHVNDWWRVAQKVRGEEWFAGLARAYIFRGKLLNHRILLALFFIQPWLFRLLGKFYFAFKRCCCAMSGQKRG